MDDLARRELNRASWNAAIGPQQSHHADPAAFLRSGGLSLFPEELALLGPLAGKHVAHLLCNAGQDSLSLARLGATVTGVDISDAAIAAARQLAAQSGIAAHFERADVYVWLTQASHRGQRFDIVYSAYGVICWLSDLAAWAKGVAQLLLPGGRLVLIEFHPLSNMFDQQWRLAYSYPSGGELLELPGVGDYVGDSQGGLTPSGYRSGVQGFANPYPCSLYRWGLAEVVSALLKAGLTLTALREYPYINGERPFAAMRAAAGRRWLPPEGLPAVPLMYGLVAERRGDGK